MGNSAERKRIRTKNTRRSDALFGYLLPLFLMALAGYQQVTLGAVDQKVLIALIGVCFSALGWNIDSMFETLVKSRSKSDGTQDDDN